MARIAVTPETAAYLPVLKADPCAYCGRSAEPWDPSDRSRSATTDHIVVDHRWHDLAAPEGRALEKAYEDWTNRTAACFRCNVQKGARPLLHFLLWRLRR